MDNLTKRQHKAPLRTRKPKITTVDDLLASDDVNVMLEYVANHKQDIDDCIIIYTKRQDGVWSYQTTRNLQIRTAIWLLEAAKLDILTQDEDETGNLYEYP